MLFRFSNGPAGRTTAVTWELVRGRYVDRSTSNRYGQVLFDRFSTVFRLKISVLENFLSALCTRCPRDRSLDVFRRDSRFFSSFNKTIFVLIAQLLVKTNNILTLSKQHSLFIEYRNVDLISNNVYNRVVSIKTCYCAGARHAIFRRHSHYYLVLKYCLENRTFIKRHVNSYFDSAGIKSGVPRKR